MRMTFVVTSVALAVVVAVQIGCGRSESARSTPDTVSGVTSGTVADRTDIMKSTTSSATSGASTAPGQPIVIHTTGNEMVLGLARDTVYMGLSDSLLAKTRADMTKDRSDTGGMGGAFADMIKKTVGNALGKRVAYPIADIQSVRYDNGAIKFDYRNKHAISFENVHTENKQVLAAFAPDDARRFVAAVNAALRADDRAQ
ncbi:MAG: hypothetical protein ACR2MQ_05545 [Gemmatimonadaceae bacterium]